MLQVKLGKLRVRLYTWKKFRGYSRWETWALPPRGRSFNLHIALRPLVHSILNWYWCLEVTY